MKTISKVSKSLSAAPPTPLSLDFGAVMSDISWLLQLFLNLLLEMQKGIFLQLSCFINDSQAGVFLA